MFDSIMVTRVKVQVQLLDQDQDMIFSFTYTKGTEVKAFEPPNMHFLDSLLKKTPLIFF